MLSRFHPIPGLLPTDRRTDGQTDGRTDRIAISISRVIVLTRDRNVEDMFIRFDRIHQRNRQTDRQTGGRTRITA